MPTETLPATGEGFYPSVDYTKILADDNIYITSDATLRRFSFTVKDMPGGALSVQAVRCVLRFKLVGGSNHMGPGVFCRYAGVDVDVAADDDTIADAGERTWPYTFTPPAGGWTPAVVSQTEFGFWDLQDSPTGGIYSVDWFEVYVDYQGSPVGLGAAREVGARDLLLGRQPTPLVELDAGLEFADVLPGQIIQVSHEEGPSDVGGWGQEQWERRPVMVLGSHVEPNGMRTLIKGLDVMQYQYLRSLWRTGRTKEAFGADQQGAIALDCGGATEFLRDSAAWLQNAPDGVWKRAEKNVERVGLDGIYMEPTRTNAQPYSSFRDGYGSGSFYTLTAGSGTIANDSTVLWFDPKDGIRYSLKLTSGNPHTVALTVVGTATGTTYYSAGSKVVVSVYHLEDFTGADFLRVRIIRTVDGWYWRDTEATWSATPGTTLIPASTTRSIWRSKVFDVGAAATGLQLEYRLPASATAGKTCWVFHGQMEEGNWASSPIETVNATPVERAAEGFRAYTSNPPHVWPLERGTLWLDFIPDWNSVDIGLSAILLDIQHGGTDFTRLRYDYSTGAWVFYQQRLGVVASASLVAAATRGTKYRIAIRWCSALGEWGLAPYTMSLWAGVAGGTLTRGTDGIPAGSMVPLATRELWFGGKDMTAKAQAGGLISRVVVSPLCLPDYMIEDL